MLEYIGDGTIWIQDGIFVPPRDLTDEEVEHFGGETALLLSGLYRRPIETESDEDEVKTDGSEF
jgi:hypothetical protein